MSQDQDDTLPLAYLDPEAYLASPNFHLTHTFTPTNSSSPITASYSLAGGSQDSTAPVLIWINGLGHHRIASVFLDGICQSFNVRLLTIDRPSSGQSTPVELRDRPRIVAETFYQILEKHSIKRCSLLVHSNGIIYANYLLLNPPPSSHSSTSLKIDSIYFTSPWILPSISRSIPFQLLSYVPPSLTTHLGSVAGGFEKYFAKSLGWSVGVVKDVWGNGWYEGIKKSTIRGGDEGEDYSNEPPNRKLLRLKSQRSSFLTRQSLLPFPEQSFGRSYFPPSIYQLGMNVALKEGLDGMGQEAIVTVRQTREVWKGNWGWLDWKKEKEEEEEGGGEGGVKQENQGGGGLSDEELYRQGFQRVAELKRRHESQQQRQDSNDTNRDDDSTRTFSPQSKIKVYYGRQDGMIPRHGQDWFRRLMVDELKLVRGEDWMEVEKAGHDEILGLRCVMEDILKDVNDGISQSE